MKSFTTSSVLNAFHTALGQFLDYRDLLEENSIKRDLYLAIPTFAYQAITEVNFLQKQLVRYGVNIITVDLQDEKVAQWIRQKT